MIEPGRQFLAAARATPWRIRRIDKELRAQECHTDELEAFAAHDYQFHHESLAAAGNRLVEKLEEMLPPLRNSREITVSTTPSIDLTCRRRRTLFVAIRLGELEWQRVMLDHLQRM